MSKNYSKTEEAPPLKKSIINKVEKQYGKDNPKTYATLWKIYKDSQHIRDEEHDCQKDHPDMSHKEWEASQDTPPDEQKEEPTNATGTSVAGTGDDSSTVVMKKKKKVIKRYKSTYEIGKNPDPELKKALKMEEQEAPVVEPNITPDDTFAGVDVFKVGDTEYNNCKLGKRKYARWDNYVDIESENGKRIYGYAKKHPKKSIIVQHDKTDHMLYLKKFEKGEE